MTDERSPRATNDRAGENADPAFTLDELCDLAGVTVRTVRYYISEGLLPPPHGHGTTARYTPNHLDRLTVIGMMKERFLPLREIRRALDQMHEREIASTAGAIRQPAEPGTRELANAVASAPPPARDASPSPVTSPMLAMRETSSAADYIADVLDRRPGRAQPAPGPRPRPAPPGPETASWRRVAISEDAELLIEEDAYHRRREQIESLVSWARRILGGT